jgi:BirA family biotin operon repressor/biotin-[acetyl-CoA-carboxylase] ligase
MHGEIGEVVELGQATGGGVRVEVAFCLRAHGGSLLTTGWADDPRRRTVAPVTSAYRSFGRPPLSAARLQRALGNGPVWREIRVTPDTASTNADLAAAARAGESEGLVLVAEHQSSGRGRLDRQWESPAYAGVLLSALLRPPVAVGSWPLLPLIAGLAIVEAVGAVGQVEATVKWPNDVTVGGRKLAGVLCERIDDAVVVGLGLNVSTTADELPVDGATSLLLVGGRTDREPLVKEVLRAFARRYQVWCDTAGRPESVMPAYRERCETIGREIDLHLPGGETVRGTVTAIDDEGRIVVRDGATGELRPWLVGDVTHVRPAE